VGLLLNPTRLETRGAGFAALWITVQIVITAAAAAATLWMSPGLDQALGGAMAQATGHATPEASWIAPLVAFWAALVGVATLVLVGMVLVRRRRMVVAASLWSMMVAVLALVSAIEFGFMWATVPIIASSAVLVLAVWQQVERAHGVPR